MNIVLRIRRKLHTLRLFFETAQILHKKREYYPGIGSVKQFWKGSRVKGLRRHFQRTRRKLQQAKQLKEVKRLEQREKRIMTHINHVISKEIVQFALDFGMGLRFEDLSGCRALMKQRKAGVNIASGFPRSTPDFSRQKKKTKSDAANNRDK